ncbi:hypothetical protein FB565_002997 [Actinoplanes lutulentus]|uniref:Uncharacterized protein n=1 Tax=Actinoplanes lutulentus TaxID=1287878 RepID=A0A327Z1T2_9ACTN|nr:hypothetical protein [Actinoplanes lutulentus]RAK28344.1 hypothetical protein B0I29_120112 [Actinoplanes lutulentus]
MIARPPLDWSALQAHVSTYSLKLWRATIPGAANSSSTPVVL